MSKFSWREVGSGFKTIVSRNALLIMGFYTLNMYSTYFKNGFRSLRGAQRGGALGHHTGYADVVLPDYRPVTRTPAGTLVDRRQDKVKGILIVASVLKAISCLMYTYLNNEVGMWISFFFDGVVWSFVGVASPALLAEISGQEAMGSAYAIFEAA